MTFGNRRYQVHQAVESEVKELFLKSVYTAGVAGTGTWTTTTPIIITQVQAAFAKVANNGYTVTLHVSAAAANPTNTVLLNVTGTAAAISITVVPNDGTNNGATPVNLTTAHLVTAINSGFSGVTITDAGSLLAGISATGGDTTALAHSGEGDGKVATITAGVSQSMTTALGNFQGFTSITETAAGAYRVVLDDFYPGGLKFAKFRILSTTARNNLFQVKAEAVATRASQYIDIFCLVTGTATNLNDGDTLIGAVEVKTVSYII